MWLSVFGLPRSWLGFFFHKVTKSLYSMRGRFFKNMSSFPSIRRKSVTFKINLGRKNTIFNGLGKRIEKLNLNHQLVLLGCSREINKWPFAKQVLWPQNVWQKSPSCLRPVDIYLLLYSNAAYEHMNENLIVVTVGSVPLSLVHGRCLILENIRRGTLVSKFNDKLPLWFIS